MKRITFMIASVLLGFAMGGIGMIFGGILGWIFAMCLTYTFLVYYFRLLEGLQRLDRGITLLVAKQYGQKKKNEPRKT
jgi:hypothetical protein